MFANLLSPLRPRSNARRLPPAPRRSTPTLEALESRYTPACSARLLRTELLIACDGANDTVTVSHPGPETLVTVNGVNSSWPDAAVTSVRVLGGGGGDNLTVTSSGHGITTALYGEAGNDAFTVGAPGGSLTGLGAQVIVDGGAGQDNVSVIDSGAGTGSHYELDASDFSRLGGETIIFLGDEALFIWTSATGNDTVTVLQNPPAGVTVGILFGGGEADTLIGPNGTNTWCVTAADKGSLNTAITFEQLESLTGGTGADTFTFADGAKVSGLINGGGGVNTLDYSQYDSDVLVNMILATTTGADQGMANIQNATGGSGNDVLVGDGAANVLRGGKGRDLLIGGDGASNTLDGGHEDNILIAGSTVWDDEKDALDEIRDLWVGPSSPTGRMALLAGLLNTGTVTASTATDEIIGGADFDWVFCHSTENPLNAEFVEHV